MRDLLIVALVHSPLDLLHAVMSLVAGQVLIYLTGWDRGHWGLGTEGTPCEDPGQGGHLYTRERDFRSSPSWVPALGL